MVQEMFKFKSAEVSKEHLPEMVQTSDDLLRKKGHAMTEVMQN